MANIRKRKGSKGVKYQVRYPTGETKSGYTYATFDTLKEARAFSENLGSLPKRPPAGFITVPEAVTPGLIFAKKSAAMAARKSSRKHSRNIAVADV
jgi:integrase